MIYLSHNARRYKIEPLVNQLRNALDNWQLEDRCVRDLKQFANVIVEECIDDYVWALTHTYVGYVGSSGRYTRTDFYADGAAAYIPDMFQAFNDRMEAAFVTTIRNSKTLRSRIKSPSKIKRLRSLALIVDEKVSDGFEDKELLSLLVEEGKEQEFFKSI